MSSRSNNSDAADSEPSQRVGRVTLELASMEVLQTYLFSLAEVRLSLDTSFAEWPSYIILFYQENNVNEAYVNGEYRNSSCISQGYSNLKLAIVVYANV